MDLTISQLLSSVWVQGGLVAAALASIGFDKSDAIKSLPGKVRSWWAARQAEKTVTETPTQRTACENRRTTLIGIRHKASELPAGEERAKALMLCDEMDRLAASLWPEAA